MSRGIIRCDPDWLAKQLGFPGAQVVGARLYGGTVDVIVDSPEIQGALVELKPVKKRKGVSYEEQETPEQPCK